MDLSVALQVKWLWRFCMEDERLWRIVEIRWGDLNWDNKEEERSGK